MKNFTSESVCAGHPDKIADQISDAIVDAALNQDSNSRVAVETLVTKNRVVLAGEVSTQAKINYKQVVRRVVHELGYTNPEWEFDYRAPISVYIQEQSPHIAQGVDSGGAGDQGIMFGYATNETGSFLPLPIDLAHRLSERLDYVREQGDVNFLRPDGKVQVRVDYEQKLPKQLHTLIVAVPHDPEVSKSQLRESLIRQVINPVLEDYQDLIDLNYQKLIINGTGTWHIGGPASDSGLTGRKIIVDTYGGFARHGGGAFSGKDPSKVDRSGAYACRYLAKNIVAAGLADQCEVRIAYVIGKPRPIALDIETFGTQRKSAKVIRDYTKSLLDLSVRGIIEGLELQQPLYQSTARYGHFGREGFPWECIAD